MAHRGSARGHVPLVRGARRKPVRTRGHRRAPPAAGRGDEIAVTESALRTGMRVGDRVPLTGWAPEVPWPASGAAARVSSRRWATSRSPAWSEACPTSPTTPTGGLGVYADAALAEAHPEIAQSNVVMVYTDDRADALAVTEELSPLLTDGDVTDGRGDASGGSPSRRRRSSTTHCSSPACSWPSPVPPSSPPGTAGTWPAGDPILSCCPGSA